MYSVRRIFILLLFLCAPFWLWCQQLVLSDVQVTGNKRTKTGLVLRTLSTKIGDTIPINELTAQIKKERSLVLNTGLFTEVKILPTIDGNQLIYDIKVREGLYFWPVPIVKIEDRNLNVWWTEYNHDLKRLSYGIKLVHLNTLGWSDELDLELLSGFRTQYKLEYYNPYINKARTLGIGMAGAYRKFKQVNVATIANRAKFIQNSEKFIFKEKNFGLWLNYRPANYFAHRLRYEFNTNDVEDDILQENPFFLGEENKSKARFSSLSYRLQYERRKNRFFNTDGFFSEFQITKNGLFSKDTYLNFLVSARVIQAFPITKKWHYEYRLSGQWASGGDRPPYQQRRGLGYDQNYVRGYEYYVFDALSYAWVKNEIFYEVFDGKVNLHKLIPKNYRQLPLNVFLSAFFDVGRADDSYTQADNPLSSQSLFGYGLGINIQAYYSNLVQLQTSVTKDGETGFFVHVNYKL